MMKSVTEADACRWLGRRVTLFDGTTYAVGRLQHVSSRNAFLLEDDRATALFVPIVRAIPLARIERISAVDAEESQR